MRPFLLLTTRPEDLLARAEAASFQRYCGLAADELRWVRLEDSPLGHVDLDEFSGVMLGGSPFNTAIPEAFKSDTQRRVEHEIGALLDRMVPADFPFLGACYGVGTLAAHQGGTLDETYGEPAAAIEIQVTDEGRRDPLLAGVGESFTAFVGHKEACSVLPPNATLLASSAACPVQMFRIGENLYGTQFHPELDVDDFHSRITVYKDAGYFPPDEFQRVHDSAVGARTAAAHRILANFARRYGRD